jgi:hypothetical protein
LVYLKPIFGHLLVKIAVSHGGHFQEPLDGFSALGGDVVFDGASDEFAALAGSHHSIDCSDSRGRHDDVDSFGHIGSA